MKSTRAAQISLLQRLMAITADLMESRATTMGRDAITFYREQVRIERAALLDDEDPALIDYEATCLVELLVELSYARLDQDKRREDRALMYLDRFRVMMQASLGVAERKQQQVTQ